MSDTETRASTRETDERPFSRNGTGQTESRASLLRDPENWPLVFHTLSNMQRRQIAGIADRSIRHLLVPSLPFDFDSWYENQVPDTVVASSEPVNANTERLRRCLPQETRNQYRERMAEAAAGELTFLGATVGVDGDEGVEWFHPAFESLPGLWALTFHGFEFLTWPVLGTDTPGKCTDVQDVYRRWMRDWDASSETAIGTEQYLRRAWTPHSVSLRILNLSRYYGWCAALDEDPEFLALLRRLIVKNALFLENHIEYDVGGNHLIENGVALVTAGVLFEQHPRRWLETGVGVLDAASEQFLPDGGHFERSPMYHVITLTRYLTALDLLRERGLDWPPALEAAAERATGFLQSIRPPDGRIPLLNDSVFGQALPLDAALAYARAVGIDAPDSSPQQALASSGYYWLGDGSNRLLVDGGAFGPRHLPGHSHNDLFSVLLWVDGTRLLTDTGVYEYAPSERRRYARSVRGHNTLQVDEIEPVPIGGQYLAGERVNPSVRYVTSGDVAVFDGEYRRTRRLGAEYAHRRRIYSADDWWLIRDDVTQSGRAPLRQRFHLHPDVTLGPHPEDPAGYTLVTGGEPRAYVLPVEAATIRETSSPYFPEFGTEIRRSSLVLDSRPDEETMVTLFSKRPCSLDEAHRLASTLSENQDLVAPVEW